MRAPIGDRLYDAVPGVPLATPPRTIHAERAVTAYENIYAGIAAEPVHPWPEVTFDDADESIGRLMGVLARESAAQRPDAVELTTLLVAELDLVLRRGEPGTAPRGADGGVAGLVGAASRYIDERYAEPVRLAQLARDLGSSPSSLRACTSGVRAAARRATTWPRSGYGTRSSTCGIPRSPSTSSPG